MTFKKADFWVCGSAQAAITEYHTLSGLNNGNLSEAGIPENQDTDNLISGKRSLPGLQMTSFFLCPHKEMERSLVFLNAHKPVELELHSYEFI